MLVNGNAGQNGAFEYSCTSDAIQVSPVSSTFSRSSFHSVFLGTELTFAEAWTNASDRILMRTC